VYRNGRPRNLYKKASNNNVKGVDEMTNADKMFEELGYEKEYEDNHAYKGELQLEFKNKEVDVAIYFYEDKGLKKISGRGIIGAVMPPAITIPELKAINEKVKELGWLDD
jgi:hypothetical protein